MIHSGKCPHCQKVINNIKFEDVEMMFGFQDKRMGYSYQCPFCSCILGVQMNPFILNDDLKEDILEEVKKMLH